MEVRGAFDFELTTAHAQTAKSLKGYLAETYQSIQDDDQGNEFKKILETIAGEAFDETLPELLKAYLIETYLSIQGNDQAIEFKKRLEVIAKNAFGKTLSELLQSSREDTLSEKEFELVLRTGELEKPHMKLVDIIEHLEKFRADHPDRFAEEGELKKRKDKKWSSNAKQLNALIKELNDIKRDYGIYQSRNITVEDTQLANLVLNLLEKHYEVAQGASQSSLFTKGKKSEFKNEMLKLAKLAFAPYLNLNRPYKKMSDVVHDARNNLEVIEKKERPKRLYTK